MKLFKILFTYDGKVKFTDILPAEDKAEAILAFNTKYEKENNELVAKIYKIKESK